MGLPQIRKGKMRPAGASGAALMWLKQDKIRQGEIGVVVPMQNMVITQTELTKVGVEGGDRTSPGAMPTGMLGVRGGLGIQPRQVLMPTQPKMKEAGPTGMQGRSRQTRRRTKMV